MYLITSPHSTIAGVFRLPDGYVCEDLKWVPERVKKGFAELLAKGYANRCDTTKWVWVCKHLEWNKPENPNQCKSAAKIALSIPDECAWKLDFMRVSAASLGIKWTPPVNPFATVGEPLLNQEQEQEQENTEAKASLSESAIPPKQSPLACPIDSLIDSFSTHLPGMPTVNRGLFKAGKGGDAMRARWRWVMTSKHERGSKKGEPLAQTAADGIAWFDRFFAYVAGSDFLTGRDGKWVACDLHWLMTASKFEAVLGGKYHTKEVAAA